MLVSELVIATPYYLLIHNKEPLGPSVANFGSLECVAIFGFSGKASYDEFSCASPLQLAPYPLVKGYLRNQVGISGPRKAGERCLKIVALDASGPCEPHLYAVTMEAVLEAHEQGATHISWTHHLTFDSAADAYQLTESQK